jgi:ADP-heptose:LPS heptosyltransferase
MNTGADCHSANGRTDRPKIAVVRALQLGDLLCGVPALRALRAALPGSRIVLLGLPGALGFVKRFSFYLDGLLEFPGFPGLPERPFQPRKFPAFLAAAQAERFDLAIQMHGSGSLLNPFTELLGARSMAGFFLPGQYCPDPQRFLPYPEKEPEVRRLLKLMEFLGFPSRGEELEFPLREEDRRELEAIEEGTGLGNREYGCLHPGARSPARRWPPERFARIGDGLAAEGLVVVLTGSSEEAVLTRAVQEAMRAEAIDLAGRTSLGSLAAILSGSRILVSNDTGVSHLAAALHVASVVVFTASDPGRWAPLDRARHRPVHHPVAVETVLREVKEVLQARTAGFAAETAGRSGGGIAPAPGSLGEVEENRIAMDRGVSPPCVHCES